LSELAAELPLPWRWRIYPKGQSKRGIMAEWTETSENELREMVDCLQLVIEINLEMEATLKDLRDSYCALLSEKAPLKYADEILAEVETALIQAEEFKYKL
jgi:hypothetical protein